MGMDTPGKRFAPYRSQADILSVVQRFRSRTLPFDEWTHQGHLATGLWFVSTFGEETAKTLLRDGIRAYNVSLGNANTDMRGYHETVTMYFIWAAARYVETRGGEPLLALVNGFVDSDLGHKDSIFAFWSRDHLLTPEALLGWREPNLRPLDPAAVPMAPAAA